MKPIDEDYGQDSNIIETKIAVNQSVQKEAKLDEVEKKPVDKDSKSDQLETTHYDKKSNTDQNKVKSFKEAATSVDLKEQEGEVKGIKEVTEMSKTKNTEEKADVSTTPSKKSAKVN